VGANIKVFDISAPKYGTGIIKFPLIHWQEIILNFLHDHIEILLQYSIKGSFRQKSMWDYRSANIFLILKIAPLKATVF
jgi:hypothetical protein